MNIINPYRFAGATGLLADYSGAAAAFSLRKLISTWTGAVVEVRRDGGSPATSTFTATQVSDGTLTTWVGAGNNGYVRTWYDQSGNGFDITQTTNGDQPIIVSSGSLVTSNGEAAIDFDGTNHYLLNAGSLSYNGGVSWYAVTDFDTADTNERLWGDDIIGAQGFCIFYVNIAQDYKLNDNNAGYKDATYASNHALSQELSSFNCDDSTGAYEYARNGSNTTGTITPWTGPINSLNTANVGVMGAGNGGQHGDGKLQELIIYPDDQSANRTGIESNINAHYGIYV